MIRGIMGLLAGLTGFYSLLILVRVLLTWFSGVSYSGPLKVLARITDPYLDWWWRIFGLRTGFIDLSPIAAIAFLSVVQNIFSTAAQYGRISLGILLAIVFSALWSAASFVLGFCLLVLLVRFIGYLTNRNMYGGFWRVIDSISQPILYRINRIIFGKRLVNYKTGLVTSILVLGAIWVSGKYAAPLLSGLLSRLPL